MLPLVLYTKQKDGYVDLFTDNYDLDGTVRDIFIAVNSIIDGV